jgi:hypothetical protein
MTDVPLAELEKEAWEEFERWLDGYITQYRAAIDRIILRSRAETEVRRRPVGY